MKIFLAHLITMGLVCKGNLEKYWDHGETVKTPFFGIYLGRNTFQSTLSNLQVSDKKLDLPRNHPHHDPLFKVKPMIEMMNMTFVQSTQALMRLVVCTKGGYISVVTTP